jgi:class 3 adenylate cyclase
MASPATAPISAHDTAAMRESMAHRIARFYLLHLEAEIAKPDEVLFEVHHDKPVRQILSDLVQRTRAEFGIEPDEPLPAENLFERWCTINGKWDYATSAFIAYDSLFFARLVDLREGTLQSREKVFATMAKGFGSFDYEKLGFSISFFLESESIMRELLRQAVREHLPALGEPADEILLGQSRAYQSGMSEYFEGVLRATLADNVRLLHGILPQEVAGELKRNGFVEPVFFDDAAVIFTDFERFSHFAAQLEPAEVLRRLDLYFSEFDRITAAHGLEKIKTIGDSYMAVAGIPKPHADPVRAACDAALEINEASERFSNEEGAQGWKIRIGIHAGPLIAGVIGKKKFSYDVWGATVNFASRMESSGEPGRINVSAEIQARVAPFYHWEARGLQPVKRLGTAEMFFLLGKKEAAEVENRNSGTP